MNWYLQAIKKYGQFSGRARRMEYWMFALFNIIFMFALAFVDGILGSYSTGAGVGLFSGLYCLFVIIPGLSVTVRRLHDTGRSGWWLLINFIPLIGPIVMLVFLFLDSHPDNEYGPNPKAIAA